MDEIRIFEAEQVPGENPSERDRAEDIAERLVLALTGWTAHANDRLPEAAQLGLQLARPEWIDIRNPAHAIHELHRIGNQLPRHLPAPSLSVEWTDNEFNAYRVLTGIRSCSDALKAISAAPDEMVSIAKSFLDLGAVVTQAHVQPWEKYAARAMRSEIALTTANRRTPPSSPNAKRRLNSADELAAYQREADKIWAENKRHSASGVARIIVERLGLPLHRIQWIRKNIARNKQSSP